MNERDFGINAVLCGHVINILIFVGWMVMLAVGKPTLAIAYGVGLIFVSYGSAYVHNGYRAHGLNQDRPLLAVIGVIGASIASAVTLVFAIGIR